ncbi:hypothetical protein LX16_1726 [Stackebrandtia albiflava]|uniref:Uncharacterized protein n=1 Tax=Stackebrandtia albiflava TaxID=406432 RepID=A0A562VDP3_9ACTN|nr:hypothetical protein [Stackebrandtia albiflava]TWJ16006.1 hypothetical protein LX16_1726 [Stackebrandtia albiflava]
MARPTTIHCRRRAVLREAVGALGLLAVGDAASAAPGGDGPGRCRAWCLRYADDSCRGGDRPACPSTAG